MAAASARDRRSITTKRPRVSQRDRAVRGKHAGVVAAGGRSVQCRGVRPTGFRDAVLGAISRTLLRYRAGSDALAQPVTNRAPRRAFQPLVDSRYRDRLRPPGPRSPRRHGDVATAAITNSIDSTGLRRGGRLRLPGKVRGCAVSGAPPARTSSPAARVIKLRRAK